MSIDKEDLEFLADKTHRVWSHWMQHFLSKFSKDFCGKAKTVTVTIPMSVYNRWIRQMHTPYQKLSDKEKQSDRTVAHEVFLDDK